MQIGTTRQTYTELGYNGFLERPFSSGRGGVVTPSDIGAAYARGSIGLDDVVTSSTFITDIVFSATDNDTAAWTAGNIYFQDGTVTEDISASNTGDISATTYIYYDPAQRGTLQTSTTASDAVGNNKTLLAIVEKVADATKKCKITPVFSTGLVVSEITADHISGNQLDVLAASTGTLDVDEYITLGEDSNVKIDGANKRIIINDGSNDRILIGYQSGGF